jgi:hypothetical protein
MKAAKADEDDPSVAASAFADISTSHIAWFSCASQPQLLKYSA